MRFRPLRPASAPDSAPIAVADPPETMRAAVIDATGGPERAARGIRRRALARAERAARARRGRGRQPDRREDPRGRGRLGSDRRVSRRCSASTSAASSCARRTSRTRCPRARRSSAWLPFPRSGRQLRRVRRRAVAVGRAQARRRSRTSRPPGVPLAALTAWGLVVETAHAHEGQRILIHAGSGGVGHFAVQFAAYFGAHVTATGSGAQRLVAARARRVGRHRLHDDPVRGCHRRCRRRHRPRRQRARDRPASAR